MRIAVSVALLALLAACGQRVVRGSGEAVEEDLDLDGFDQVQVADALTVVILPAEQDRVTLVGDDNVVDEVEADVDGDRLELSVDDRVTLADADLVVEVRVRELTALTASGASSVTLDRDLDAEELRVQLSGPA